MPQTSACSCSHQSSFAPPPVARTSDDSMPRRPSRSIVSENSHAIASKRARMTSTPLVARVMPSKVAPCPRAPDACGRGVRAASAKTSPGSAPTAASARFNSGIEMPKRSRAQSMTLIPFGFVPRIPNPVGPGCGQMFIPSLTSSAGHPASTASVKECQVPHARATTPGSTAPAPTEAANASHAPATMSTSDGRPSSLATLGRMGPMGVAFGCTSGSHFASIPVSSIRSADQLPEATS